MPNTPSRPALPRIRAHWRELFHSLMPYRIREVLLVSSAYDAFLLEEDGVLPHRIFADFAELELTWAPRITHAATAEAALALLRRRPFQLVIIATSLIGTDAVELGRQLRVLHPSLPLVLMVFDEAQLTALGPARPQHFDQVFLWSGDSNILIAIVKLMEDALNIEHDVEVADVQVVLVVEDSVRAYSTFLTQLYPELLRQSRSLIAEGVNEFHRLLRIHARPKIVLTRSYEDAIHVANHWNRNLMGAMSNVEFPRREGLDAEAGIDLARLLQSRDDPPPVLLQSSDASVAERAQELEVVFADKNSPEAMNTVRLFLQERMGFGDFVFRLPDGTPVGGARSVSEMAAALEHVPLESILHHAKRHDFSRWLKARSMFQIARHTRGVTLGDFRSPERVRDYLCDLLREASDHDQAGAVTDMRSATRSPSNRFVRIGDGSLGGKARSIGFSSAILVQEQLQHRYEELEINIPRTAAIGVAEYDRFVQSADLKELEQLDDSELRRRLLEAPLSPEILAELRDVFSGFNGPVAVRSSSLREDARFQPFAGVYATYMLPNNHPDPEVRFSELCRAIKAVYASMFTREARIYSAGHPHGAEDEKMAVVVQQVVGQQFGDRFYPHISGVVQSFNYYPVGPQRADEGLAVIALGLGQMVVAGGGGLRFSPAHPDVLPQFTNPGQVLEYSQRQFYALDLSSPLVDLVADPGQLLRLYDLDAAEADGTLTIAGSVYSADDNAIRENLGLAGPRVVTFANVLRWKAIPLAAALRDLLDALCKAMSSEVEIEFAVDMGDWGRTPPADRKRYVPRLYVLQARPMAGFQDGPCEVDFEAFSDEQLLVRAGRSLGNGRIDDVTDIVYVRSTDITSAQSREAARELREFDHAIGAEGRRYLLIGPGRWGSSDARLGLPVEWLHISNARVIVEMPLRGEYLESSQGTHFFHNLTAARLGYLTATPDTNGLVDLAWLEAEPAVRETELVRHVLLDRPLSIQLDGRHGRAVVVKPAAPR